MTTPIIERKRPPATILYRATPFTVFRTLLWAELASRRRVLSIAVLLQLLLCIHSYTWNLDFEQGVYGRESPPPFDGTIAYLALGAMAYCAFFKGLDGFSARAPWQSLALPVHLHTQLLVGLAFQVVVALLLGALWGLYRYLGNEDAPFLHPLLGLAVLAIQGHSAVLWCAAAGVARGLAISVAGLMGAAVCGILLGNFGPFTPNVDSALVLFAFGMCSCLVAARAIRGGPVPLVDFRNLPGVASLHRWQRARALRRPRFASPFLAQVWFEWHRSARWLVFASAAIAAAMLLLDTPYILTQGRSLFSADAVIGESKWSSGIVYLGLPFLFWYVHIAVTDPYRRFVFTRPHTIEQMSAAKLLAAFLAAIPLTMILESTRWCYDMLLAPHGVGGTVSETIWSIAFSLAGSILTTYLFLIAGPVLAFVIMPVMMLLFFPLILPGNTIDDSPFALGPVALPFNALIVSLALLPFALACVASRRRLDLKAGSFPWELAVAFAVMPVCTVIGIVERLTSASQFGLTGLLTFCPVLMLLATFRYGLREKLLLPRQRAMLYVVLAGVVAESVYPLANPKLLDAGMAAGYMGALICCAFVFYPLAIRNQREATLWAGVGKLPQWALFLISPFAWLAFHTIGEELSEQGVRS